MKFSEYLVKITGVSIFPMISLFLFVAFFLGVTWYVFRMNKEEVEHIENLPLND